MFASVEKNAPPITSATLHNRNCFSYLKNLLLTDLLLNIFPSQIKDELQRIQNHEDYTQDYAYADLYTKFFDYIDENINIIYKNYKNDNEMLKQLNTFVLSIYANENSILESTYQVIKDVPRQHAPMSGALEKQIARKIKDHGTPINIESKSPAQLGSTYSTLTAMISKNLKTQHTTNIATIRHYKATAPNSFLELRFGVQAQRDNGVYRVSPLFKRFLKIQAELITNTNTITHIYFNNLGRDRHSITGKQEKALTKELEKIENEHPNIAVITLPADQGLMNNNFYKKTQTMHDTQAIRHNFFSIASQHINDVDQRNTNCRNTIEDFYISDRISSLLFTDLNDKNARLNMLLDNSFIAMGMQNNNKLSHAQMQAVWFHFIKFELPNYIIATLNPMSINFTCKDAIDRGGVSSAYYNLIKSFEIKTPMDREEFECALHSAAAMVKGRGMNWHINMIWNAVDAYITNHYAILKNSPNKTWLIEWRDCNCPHARIDDLLKQRAKEIQSELNQLKTTDNSKNLNLIESIDISNQILTIINTQIELGISGKRLLLETAIRTATIVLNPTAENIRQYEQLAESLSIKYPKLYMLGGLMKALIGIIVKIFTGGAKQELLNAGLATFRTGNSAAVRREMQTHMRDQIQLQKSIISQRF